MPVVVGPSELRAALLARNVELNGPARSEDLESVEQALGAPLPPSLRKIYVQFDGFASPDRYSEISMWPLSIVMSRINQSIELDGQKYIAVGDVLIDSDFIMLDLESDASPVMLLYEKRSLASTISAFFEKLLAGDLDIAKSS